MLTVVNHWEKKHYAAAASEQDVGLICPSVIFNLSISSPSVFLIHYIQVGQYSAPYVLLSACSQ